MVEDYKMYKVGDKLKLSNNIKQFGNFVSNKIYEIAMQKQENEDFLIFDDKAIPVYFDEKELSFYFVLVVNEDKTIITRNDLSFFDKTKDEFGLKVEQSLSNIGNMLIEKNRKYGNSALQPVRIFSKMPKDEQLKVRIDDKLSRISSSQSDEDEDVISDLIGYLVLLEIAKKVN